MLCTIEMHQIRHCSVRGHPRSNFVRLAVLKSNTLFGRDAAFMPSRGGAQGSSRREDWGGVWDPNICVPKMARSDFPDGKFRFFPRWSFSSGGEGEGGSGGGGVPHPPPAVHGRSNTPLGHGSGRRRPRCPMSLGTVR